MAGPEAAAAVPLLSPFKPKQQLLFVVLAHRHETDWKVPTLCARILLSDGSQIRSAEHERSPCPVLGHILCRSVTDLREAIYWLSKDWNSSQVSSSPAISSPRVEPHAVAAMNMNVVQDRDAFNPADFGQLECDKYVNVAGILQHLASHFHCSPKAWSFRSSGYRFGHCPLLSRHAP